jgi:hypothetical protein
VTIALQAVMATHRCTAVDLLQAARDELHSVSKQGSAACSPLDKCLLRRLFARVARQIVSSTARIDSGRVGSRRRPAWIKRDEAAETDGRGGVGVSSIRRPGRAANLAGYRQMQVRCKRSRIRGL